MTAQQIKWAASHDWFIGVVADGASVVVIDAYTTRDGKFHQEHRRFDDFRTLRNWAGY